MKKKILLCSLSLVALSSCDFFNKENSKTESVEDEIREEESTPKQHDYSEISNRMILWDDIFKIEKEKYYVYFFSKTCSHCTKIKDYMIENMLQNHDIFACEAAYNHVILSDISKTIGDVDKIEFGILGYPSVIYVENRVLKTNAAGETNIRKLFV